MGLALASVGPILEVAGTGFIRHGKLLAASHRGDPYSRPRYQNVAMQTHNRTRTVKPLPRNYQKELFPKKTKINAFSFGVDAFNPLQHPRIIWAAG